MQALGRCELASVPGNEKVRSAQKGAGDVNCVHRSNGSLFKNPYCSGEQVRCQIDDRGISSLLFEAFHDLRVFRFPKPSFAFPPVESGDNLGNTNNTEYEFRSYRAETLNLFAAGFIQKTLCEGR